MLAIDQLKDIMGNAINAAVNSVLAILCSLCDICHGLDQNRPRERERKKFRRKWREGHGRLYIEGSQARIIKESTKAAVEEGQFIEL